jgi:hypothetical protein
MKAVRATIWWNTQLQQVLHSGPGGLTTLSPDSIRISKGESSGEEALVAVPGGVNKEEA